MILQINLKGLIIVVLIFILYSEQARAQAKDTASIQLSGLVVTADSLKPIPFASISVQGTTRGALTDLRGYYSLPVYRNEILLFSSVGYKGAYYQIPDTLKRKSYSLIQSLPSDTLYLPETFVFPWQTYEQFKAAFLKVEPADEAAYAQAVNNIEKIRKSINTYQYPVDATNNYIMIRNNWANKARNIGFMPSIGIMIGF
jgi:hypothetical protein